MLVVKLRNQAKYSLNLLNKKEKNNEVGLEHRATARYFENEVNLYNNCIVMLDERLREVRQGRGY